ncbi:hypothetical protein ACFLUG_03145 [Chloroflexota bacterium]
MARKIIPIERVVEDSDYPSALFIDPEDVIEIDPDDINVQQDDQEE